MALPFRWSTMKKVPPAWLRTIAARKVATSAPTLIPM